VGNIWTEIGTITPDLASPHSVIREMVKGIKEVTDNKVDFRLQKVDFFPEEVRYTTIRGMLTTPLNTSTLFDEKKEISHPEFGYDPRASKVKESIRYRFLLFQTKDTSFEVELFKFKYPLSFYPVTFFIEKSDFPELADQVTPSGLDANNEAELQYIVSAIIRSDSTLKLIRRIMAL